MELLAMAIILTFASAQESQLKGPQNTLSFVGSTVTLKCSPPSRNCNGIDWQKYMPGATPITVFKGPGTMLNVVDRDRYSVDNSSGCDLVIRNVQLKDAGRFICSAILSSSQETKTAYLIVLETHPKCKLYASDNSTVDRDEVQLKCEVTYNGTNIGASMVWKGVTDVPAAVYNGKTISRSFFRVASAPEIPSFTCETSFAYETHETSENSRLIDGLATNKIPNATCSTPVTKVFYSVRDVSLSPSYYNFPPGTGITCTAKGHPSPDFKWQENEDNGVWMDIPNQNRSQFTMSNISSRKYRCVAMNIVRGKIYNDTSHEFLVNNTDATTAPVTSGLSFTLTEPLAIGGGVGIGVVLLLIVVIIICFCVPCCPGYNCCNSGKKDRVAQHQDHEMSQRSGAPIVGEQEAAYASLGEDRDANEYASLEKRQKSKTREKVGEQESTYASLREDREISEYASLEQGQKTETSETVKVLDQESAYASLGEDRDVSEYESLEQRQKSKPKKKSKL